MQCPLAAAVGDVVSMAEQKLSDISKSLTLLTFMQMKLLSLTSLLYFAIIDFPEQE